jgi:hypothetical protein
VFKDLFSFFFSFKKLFCWISQAFVMMKEMAIEQRQHLINFRTTLIIINLIVGGFCNVVVGDEQEGEIVINGEIEKWRKSKKFESENEILGKIRD